MGKAGGALAQRGRADRSDHDLVRAVRRGDERAFELLYARYQRRIAAYVSGMVNDHGRAEDITQEVFVSALRRMRATERPIAFKPWIYEIARNACIDAHRRRRRREEVSYDADGQLTPADHGKLVAGEPEPPAAVAVKQDLDHLCGAFGGLTPTHHEILVLRELEGLSYAEIGERMGISLGAVESTLFRARKRLGEEYEELASGARCVRVQALIADAPAEQLGARDARRVARHVSHCQPCRRMALQAGLDVPARRGLGGRIAAWLPLPGFLRAGGWGTTQAFEALQPGWGKAIAGVAALLVVGAGAGTVLEQRADGAGAGDAPTAVARGEPPPTGASLAEGPVIAGAAGSATVGDREVGARARDRGDRIRGGVGGVGRVGGTARRGGAGAGDGHGGGGGAGPGPGADGGGAGRDGGEGGGADGNGGGGGNLPAPGGETPVRDAVDRVDETVQDTTQTVENTTQNVTDTVDDAVDEVQQVVQDPVGAALDVGATVDGAVADVETTVDGATGTVGGVLGP